MFRKIAEVSEGINSVALVGSARSSANSPRDLIDGVETKLSSSLEIVWLEVFVKVPCKETTWLLLKVPPESATAEIFNPVMLTESPSAACDDATGILRSPIPRPTIAKTDVTREDPSRIGLNCGADSNTR
jgi:hypothetical protein